MHLSTLTDTNVNFAILYMSILPYYICQFCHIIYVNLRTGTLVVAVVFVSLFLVLQFSFVRGWALFALFFFFFFFFFCCVFWVWL